MNLAGPVDFSLMLNFSRTVFGGGQFSSIGGRASLAAKGSNRMMRNVSANPKRLASGAVISNGQSFNNGGALHARSVVAGAARSKGTWPKSGTGFAGVKFKSNGQTFFGWIRLEWQDTTNQGFPNKLTAIDWAYNDVAGAPINAGQGIPTTTTTPEPSSMALALMAAGCVGVLAWRKRRQAIPTATNAAPSEP
jgi:hypothetical protein